MENKTPIEIKAEAYANKEWDFIPTHSLGRQMLVAAFIAGSKATESAGVTKYFIEDKRTQKWLRIGEMFDSSKNMVEQDENRWTNDPHQAIRWNTFKEAEDHNKKYFNMPDIEVTEHEFSSPSPSLLQQENERLKAALKELVELEDLEIDEDDFLRIEMDYETRKPLAWEAARKLLNT